MAEKDQEEKQNIGKVVPRELSEEIQQSYLDYSMSVIVSRALPDVRDGLKPVNRRILYAMWRQGLRSNSKFRKAANVVGNVMAQYHPHGDMAIYDALARMTQDFSMRYPLVDGQGNWGSLDGDNPAAPRYTEARLEKIADEILTDIDKETVDTVPNYDGTRREPSVLPALLPDFILNGTVGIAVGMATNVPPHNLNEICDAAIHVVENPEATIDDLMKFVKGPDFPTGGIIYNKKEIKQAYATGKGSIVTRAQADIEEHHSGTYRIIVSEIPYMVNKAALITKIAEQVRTKRIEGIKDLRDESDKDGVRIVIELKRDTYPRKVLNRLFSITDLQKTFHLNMLALVDRGRQPKILTLKEVLEEHIAHRRDVIVRRTTYDLNRAKERAHILEGLKKALDHIDEIIATIKKSKNRETAHANLQKGFKLSEAQATAILEMRLQTLSGLERKKVEDELKEKRKLIKELEGILADPNKVSTIIKDDYNHLKEAYGDARRTKVHVRSVSEFSQEDLIPDEPAIITVTRGGYIKRLATSTYRVQRRGGKGVRGMATKEEDIVDLVLSTTTHKRLLFFTNRGRVFSIQAYDIPASSRQAKGQALPNFLELASDEHVTAIQELPDQEDSGEFLIMATKNGMIKKTPRQDFENIRRTGLKAINLKGADTLEWVNCSTGKDTILLVTHNGKAIRFEEKDVRAMGRTAAGVRAIKLGKGDEVAAMHVIAEKQTSSSFVLVITEEGFGKLTPLSKYRKQGRGGSGIKTAKITARTGSIVNAGILGKDSLKQTDVLIISQKGQVIRIKADNIPSQSRDTQGVRVMRPTNETSKVATFTAINNEE